MDDTKDSDTVRIDINDGKPQASKADKVTSRHDEALSISHLNAKNAPQSTVADEDSDPDLEDLDGISR